MCCGTQESGPIVCVGPSHGEATRPYILGAIHEADDVGVALLGNDEARRLVGDPEDEVRVYFRDYAPDVVVEAAHAPQL